MGALTEKIRQYFANQQKWSEIAEDDEYAAQLKAIGYGEKSLLVMQDGGGFYQIIDCGGGYLFVSVNDRQFITDFDNIPDEVFAAKRNFVIDKSDITSMDIVADFDPKRQSVIAYAEIKLHWNVRVGGKKGYKKQKRTINLIPTDDIEEEPLRRFFEGAGRVRVMTDEEYDDVLFPKLPPQEAKVKKRLLTAVVVIPIAAVLCIAGAARFHNEALRRFLVTVSALLPFVLFALYLAFPRVLVIRREDREASDGRTIDMDLSLGITALAAGGMCLYGGCGFYNWPLENAGRWALIALVPFGVLLVLLLTRSPQIRNNRWKNSLYTLALCVIYAGIACGSAVYLLNYSLDVSVPRTYQAAITDKWAEHEGEYRAIPSYYVETAREHDVYERFQVFYKRYQAAQRGDAVTVEEHRGALWMPYDTIKQTER